MTRAGGRPGRGGGRAGGARKAFFRIFRFHQSLRAGEPGDISRLFQFYQSLWVLSPGNDIVALVDFDGFFSILNIFLQFFPARLGAGSDDQPGVFQFHQSSRAGEPGDISRLFRFHQSLRAGEPGDISRLFRFHQSLRALSPGNDIVALVDFDVLFSILNIFL
ncbi:MAG: hypothetical protein LBO05_07555 [Deltaproteobacteria bacterium]|jgi:hypothetical protein|nr:hypothetical protein [Deltaproteobacteria bacterium]